MLSFHVKCAIIILGELHAVQGDKEGLSTGELKVRSSFPAGLTQVLKVMKNTGLIGHQAYRGKYYIQADLSALTLSDLIEKIDGASDKGTTAISSKEWPETSNDYSVAKNFDKTLDKRMREVTDKITLSQLIRQSP